MRAAGARILLLGLLAGWVVACGDGSETPGATATQEASATATAVVVLSPTSTGVPGVTATAVVSSPTPVSTEEAGPTATTVVVSPTPTPTRTPGPSPTATRIVTVTVLPTGTPDVPIPTPTVELPSPTPTVSLTPTITPGTPDLEVSSLVPSTFQALRNDEFTVVVTVSNTGVGTAPATSVAVYLSQDSVITTEDLRIGLGAVGQLAPGASVEVLVEVGIPSATGLGSYSLGAIVDRFDLIAELSETNNTRSVPFNVPAVLAPTPTPVPSSTVTPTLSDLYIETFSPSVTQAGRGEAITVTVKIGNLGAGVSPTTRLALYLSADGIITFTDSLLTVVTVGPINPEESVEMSIPVNIPLASGLGFQYLGGLVDQLNEVTEQREDNNTASVQFWVVVPPTPTPTPAPTPIAGLPDLVALGISSPKSQVQRGEAITFTVTVGNLGTEPASPSTVGLYLSPDISITAADLLLGTAQVVLLNPQVSVQLTISVTIPTALNAGQYFLGGLADVSNTVTEGSEVNNTIFILLTVN